MATEKTTYFDPRMVDRRFFMKATGAILAGAALGSRLGWATAAEQQPNVIFIFCDDLGYGDVGCFGSKIATPNIDSIAKEGVRFTHFSASPLCSPSRAQLLTGRYCTRVNVPNVLGPNSAGLDISETTLADVFKSRGYSTICIGKWHVGDQKGYLPTDRGFDEFYGVLYPNNMPIALMHNTEIIENPATQATLTKRYTEQALKYIERSKDKPFFLYLAHKSPHIPLAASEDFVGKSGMGLYADEVMEIDWSVGEILKALKKYGLEKNTLVIFTSDNGPAIEGSTGGLKGYKGSTWEGGVREPFVAKLPGQIPAGLVCSGVAANIDILPTLADLAGAKLPSKPLDGVDIWPMFTGKQNQIEREALLYWEGWYLTAARLGKWKVRFRQGSLGMGGGPPMSRQPNSSPGSGQPGNMSQEIPKFNATGAGQPDNPPTDGPWMGEQTVQSEEMPVLYSLEDDPSESKNVAKDHPDVVAEITGRVERLIPGFPETVQKAWAETKAKMQLSNANPLP